MKELMKELLPFIIVFFLGVYWGVVVTEHIGQKMLLKTSAHGIIPKPAIFNGITID